MGEHPAVADSASGRLMTAIQLRLPQSEAIAAVRNRWRQRDRKVIVVLPTGVGKTIMALSLVVSAVRKGLRVLWLAHRKELLTQPLRSLTGLWPEMGLLAGIVQASADASHARIVFGSSDTLRGEKRLERLLKHGKITFVVVDEAHHSVSPTYKKILGRLDNQGGAPPWMLGLTATPERADGKELGDYWNLAYSYSLYDAINNGYLVPVVHRLEQMPGLVLPETGSGDFNDDELAERLLMAGVVEHTVSAITRHARGRATLTFTASVEQARLTAEALTEAGVLTRWVSGETPSADRQRLLRAFEDGHIQGLVNCAVLTEGTDLPRADCVTIARPTRSKPLY